MPLTEGARLAPTLDPTSLPDCDAPPCALIHSIVLSLGAFWLLPSSDNADGSIHADLVDTGPP